MSPDLSAAYLAALRGGGPQASPAGFGYLMRVIQRASLQGEAGKGYRNLPPSEVCAAFRAAAAADFGPFLDDALGRLGIRTGAELGECVLHLASHGLLTLGPGESLEAFAACGPLGAAA